MKFFLIGLFALGFVSVGIAHFVRADLFLSIMPPYLPVHRELVYISGAFEILGGLGLLIPNLRPYAGYGLMALLLAVFPANIHMAINPGPFIARGIPLWVLYLRLPLQFLLMFALWWATKTS